MITAFRQLKLLIYIIWLTFFHTYVCDNNVYNIQVCIISVLEKLQNIFLVVFQNLFLLHLYTLYSVHIITFSDFPRQFNFVGRGHEHPLKWMGVSWDMEETRIIAELIVNFTVSENPPKIYLLFKHQ